MANWPPIVTSFPLRVDQAWQAFTKLPADTQTSWFHYTTREGLEGILRSGGLRATYRMRMNDSGEFSYAKNRIFTILDDVIGQEGLSNATYQIAEYTKINLQNFLDNSDQKSSSYCACLTVSPDDPSQWDTYAAKGQGFSIGFDMEQILRMQVFSKLAGKPFLVCAPVVYTQDKQFELVENLISAGIADLRGFIDERSDYPIHLTALRDRITREIVAILFALINFIKAPVFQPEREIRLILDSNDDTWFAPTIHSFERGNESIPFLFFDLRIPSIGILPISEVKIGPVASFLDERLFLEQLFGELRYGCDGRNQPQISQSMIG